MRSFFVDPLSELSGQQSPGQFNVEDKASFRPEAALHRLGRRYDPTKVVTDAELAQQVQFGGGGIPRVVDYIAWMRMMPENFNLADPAVGNLQLLNIASAGALKAHMGATTKFVPLISSSQ